MERRTVSYVEVCTRNFLMEYELLGMIERTDVFVKAIMIWELW